jgi:hypothetical protein
MPISFSQTANLECPQCYKNYAIEVWLIIDTAERPDLAARCRDDSIFFVKCPHYGNIERLGAPLLFHNHASEKLILAVPPTIIEQQAREIHQQLMPHLPANMIAPFPAYFNQTCWEAIPLCKITNLLDGNEISKYSIGYPNSDQNCRALNRHNHQDPVKPEFHLN